MLIATTENISGMTITETLGMVRGSIVWAKHIGKDIVAGLRFLVGGEIVEYTVMLQEAREKSLQRMVAEAKALGADAVIGMRFLTAPIMNNASECICYGTAVKVAQI